MVKRCVAAGCGSTLKDGVSLFSFPKDATLRRKWAAQVRRTRDKWEPTEHSYLCSKHFEDHCFEAYSKLSATMGMKVKQRLTADAVPSIFEKPQSVKRKAAVADTVEPKKKDLVLLMKNIVEEVLNVSIDANSGGADGTMLADVTDIANSVGCQVSPQSSDDGIQCHTTTKAIGVQTKPLKTRDFSVQCTSFPAPPLPFLIQSNTPVLQKADEGEIELCETTESEATGSDEDYSETDEQYSDHPESAQPLHKRKKFIVFEECLMALFEECWCCRSTMVTTSTQVNGTFLSVAQHCSSCLSTFKWDSQPMIRNIPSGNILLSAAILFTGALPAKVLRFLSVLGCASISKGTYFAHQKAFLFPSVFTVWNQHQATLFKKLHKEKRALVLGGDGRADSPGHSAKYGSYTFMELKEKAVIDIQLVQSNEVKGSYHMEMEGLIRGIKLLRKKKFKIATLVTDRHKQIAKWLRDNAGYIDHRYDIWHLAKSFKKKIDAAAKEKECELIGEWRKSLVNHMYWSAVSTPDGDGNMILAKWLSVDNHIHNKHGKVFPSCKHKAIRKKKGRKKWFKPHTKPSEKVSAIIQNKAFCKDLRQMSPTYQTSACEAFHSVVITFAPKSTAFSYKGMRARLFLAALHYNENRTKKHATTKKGDKRYSILFPKYKKGGYIVRKVMEESSYGYVEDLFDQLNTLVHSPSHAKQSFNMEEPPALSSTCDQPVKEEAISEHKSRFSQFAL